MSQFEQYKRKAPKAAAKRTEPVWKGPEVDGITFSLLSRYLVCKERFRLLVVEGLKPADTFNHRLSYGEMWHLCEEVFAACKPPASKRWKEAVEFALSQYAEKLCKRYPMQQDQVIHWYEVCKLQFPVYVDYWARQKDVKDRIPLLQEVSFKVPYVLPSGRVVLLRGKWDSVDLIGRGTEAGIYLQENKTKGEIDEVQILRQLTWDLQTMIYLVSLEEQIKTPLANGSHFETLIGSRGKLRGIRYNVVRRPLSGGKGTIVQKKPTKSNPQGESREDYYKRVEEYIRAEPETYFMRWKVEVTQGDIERFKQQTLVPILESLCDWWNWVSDPEIRDDPFQMGRAAIGGGAPEGPSLVGGGVHMRAPYGVWNPMLEGRPSDLDEYLATGSTLGLQATDNLFPELD